ncbi:MAG: hypothetical protein ACRCT2_02110 [Plesiomonas shigelloides]
MIIPSHGAGLKVKEHSNAAKNVTTDDKVIVTIGLEDVGNYIRDGSVMVEFWEAGGSNEYFLCGFEVASKCAADAARDSAGVAARGEGFLTDPCSSGTTIKEG